MAQRSNSYFGQLHVMFVLPLGPVGHFFFVDVVVLFEYIGEKRKETRFLN